MSPVYICTGKRTPIGRYGGALSMVRPDDMAAHVIDAVLQAAPGITVDEVILGCANQAGEDNRNVARMAVLLSRLPETVPALTLNRLCASGLDAVIAGARAIEAGAAEVVIAGGVESMSRAPFVMPTATAGIDSRPETAENVAAEFGISRPDQDAFALRSQARYSAGWHAADIAPVTIPGRKGEAVVVATDEHPRPTSLERLAALPAPFRAGGTVTAGNASGINDGAAALLLASESAIARHGLTPLARIGAAAAAGVAPRLMGIGPVAALARLTARTGLTAQDFDVIELNEAFAAQALACTRAWGLPDEAAHVNRYGGAIAMGHPLGMSGARIALSAARQLHETGGRHALATLCVGVGQGVALVLHAV